MHTLFRTVLWIVVVPVVTLVVGLAIALIADRMKRPGLAKSLIFMPTDTENYAMAQADVALTVTKSMPAISWPWSHFSQIRS